MMQQRPESDDEYFCYKKRPFVENNYRNPLTKCPMAQKRTPKQVKNKPLSFEFKSENYRFSELAWVGGGKKCETGFIFSSRRKQREIAAKC